MCNCWLGILNAYDQCETNNLYTDSIKKRLSDNAKHSRNMSAVAKNWKAFAPKDYIDKRKGLSTLFNFCPWCGLKINWKQIRKNL